MNLLEKAYRELFPDKDEGLRFSVKYSAAFNDFNANIRQYSKILEIRLSKKWRSVSPEIQMGLIQSLLLKLYKKSCTEFID